MSKPAAHTSTPQAIEHVTLCFACPFHDNDRGRCEADAALRSVATDQVTPPDWCPLRSGPILVKLKVP